MNPLYKQNDKKRLLRIAEDDGRSPFLRDNGRLVHSAAFRRLQGKTQLFPNCECDFFRNRLTHSIEVALIAKGIVSTINSKYEYFKINPVDRDLVETICLAHDLGHPPFGHNGEKALDDLMRAYGGFEGNAQTLRILSRLEKRSTNNSDFKSIENGQDKRLGLNLCYRTLASVIKRDKMIKVERNQRDPFMKGYYYTEKEFVKTIKEKILGKGARDEFKTIECQIMDIADDIANSTYDLEDTFKACFFSPLDYLTSNIKIFERIVEEVNPKLDEKIGINNIYLILFTIFGGSLIKESNSLMEKKFSLDDILYFLFFQFNFSKTVCDNGYIRTDLTSALIRRFMSGIIVEVNKEKPVLSKVFLNSEIKKEVEVLKKLTYYSVIESPRLKITEFRGYDIVKEIFTSINNSDRRGFNLLPEDFQELYRGFEDKALKMRVICDFVAGMTDKYAVEFYARLKSENPQTIFKPF